MYCSRIDCENIMCDHYIYDIGYICNSCLKEFRYQYCEASSVTSHEWKDRLKKFMDTPKKYREDFSSDILTLDNFLDNTIISR